MTLRDAGRNAAYRSLYLIAGRRHHDVVLLYHSVGASTAFSVSADDFERQVALVAERFHVVPLAELSAGLRDPERSKPLACLTFDDGYRDNREKAAPVLARHGLRATFFVAAGFLGRHFKSFAGLHAMMTVDDVRALAAEGHEIGAHTVTHRKLTRLPSSVAYEEATQSRAMLEDIVGQRVSSFAYPKGAYDDAVKHLVAVAGFERAAAIHDDVLGRDVDWFALPRIAVHPGLSAKAFEAKLSAASRWYHAIRNGFRMSA